MFCAAAVLCLGPAANATTLTFATPPNFNFSGKPVNALAIFDMDSLHQQITVKILNMQVDPTDASQLVSGVAFTLSNGQLAGTLSSMNSTAYAFDIAGNGKPSATRSIGTDWLVETTRTALINTPVNGLLLCEVCQSGAAGGVADELIAGGVSPANNKYAPSLDNYKSLLLGSGGTYTPTFQLNLNAPVLTAASAITNVTFTFGQSFLPQYQVGGELLSPEPAPAILVLAGLGAVCLYRKRRGKAQSAVSRTTPHE